MIPFDCEFWTSIETTSSSMQWWPERKISQIVVPWQHPWKSNTKQRMVFRMIHVKDSLLPRGKVWSLDFLGFPKFKKTLLIVSHILLAYCGRWSTSFDPKNLSGMFYFIWVVVSNIFNFHPDPWGNDPIWRAYFSDGLVQPPTSHRNATRASPASWSAFLRVVQVLGGFFGRGNGVDFFWDVDEVPTKNLRTPVNSDG